MIIILIIILLLFLMIIILDLMIVDRNIHCLKNAAIASDDVVQLAQPKRPPKEYTPCRETIIFRLSPSVKNYTCSNLFVSLSLFLFLLFFLLFLLLLFKFITL